MMMIPRAATALILATAVLAAQGPVRSQVGSLTGTYTGTNNGQPTTLQLTQDAGGRLSGSLRDGFAPYRLTGKSRGTRLQGTLQHQVFPLTLQFTGQLQGPTLRLQVRAQGLGNGRTAELVVTRNGAAPSRGAVGSALRPLKPTPKTRRATPSGQRDPRLLGTWRRTITSRTTGYTGTLNTASDTFTTLRPDGRFIYKPGGMAYNQHGRRGTGGGQTAARGMQTGVWKTQNGILYYKLDGLPNWVASGRYTVQPRHLLVVTPSGQKQLWER